jgi:hypothetical protein
MYRHGFGGMHLVLTQKRPLWRHVLMKSLLYQLAPEAFCFREMVGTLPDSEVRQNLYCANSILVLE